jgi:hypothetical protein
LDRWIHADQYPILFYPQLYLIDGGYKNCFETCQAICQEPIQYLKMQDKAFVQECKIAFTRFRRQWKQHKTNLCASRLQAIHYGGES